MYVICFVGTDSRAVFYSVTLASGINFSLFKSWQKFTSDNFNYADIYDWIGKLEYFPNPYKSACFALDACVTNRTYALRRCSPTAAFGGVLPPPPLT